jgi:hypothetical protein
MKNRTTQLLYAYWNEVRRGSLAPRRFDIEPARIAGLLAQTIILEQTDRHSYRFRLAGTRIVEQFARELRGTDFLQPWSSTDAESLALTLQRIANDGGVGVLEMDARTADGRSVAFEAIILPLIHTRGTVDRFLGAISTIEAPAWLGTEPIVSLTLTRREIVWPDGRPHSLASRMGQPPALAPQSAHGRIVRSQRRQFRVLDGGLGQEPPHKT